MSTNTAKLVNAAEKSGSRIAILDGFRALAIGLVILFHYSVRWAPPRDPGGHFPAGALFDHVPLFTYGWVGVELFFVISGFVILMTLERCRSVFDFAVRRFARLWPPLLMAAILTTLVMAWIGPADWHINPIDFFTSMVIVHPDVMSLLLHHPDIKWVDGAYWSLFVEIRFYILAAVVYLIARRRFVAWWLVFQMLAYAAYLVVLHVTEPKSMGALAFQTFLFPRYMPYFTLGVCIFEIYSSGALRRVAMAGCAVAAAMILYSATQGVLTGEGDTILGFVIANVLILGLFYLFTIDHPALWIFKRRPIVLLGQASYSLYLIHQQIGVAVMSKAVALGVPYLVILPITIAGVTIAAVLLFKLWENPAKSRILKWSKRPTAALDRRLRWLTYA